MSTRGAVGFHRGGTDKIMYNHSDSYPSHLGVSVATFVQSHSIEEMNETFDRIVLVNRKTPPTCEQITACKQFFDAGVSTGEENEWYALLRHAQGDLEAYAKGLKYMEDRASFLKDSLFCEWGYVINLDTQTVEIYRGFQHKPDENRYYINEPSDNIGAGYYNCKLIRNVPFSEITADYMKSIENEIYREDDIVEFVRIAKTDICGLFSQADVKDEKIVRDSPSRATIRFTVISDTPIWRYGEEDVTGTVNNAVRKAFGTKSPLPETDVGHTVPSPYGYKTNVRIELYFDGEYGK